MIRREDRGEIAVLHLEHGKVNAIDLELLDALQRTMITLDRDAQIKAAVVTGTGGNFSAGVDLYRMLDENEDYFRQFIDALERLLETLFIGPVPTVAAINGHAIAGGCILAAACDRRLMAEGKGKIGVSELQVGVPFPQTALAVLRALLPFRHLYDLVTSGRLVEGPEAKEMGLVDELVPADELLDRAIGRAQSFAAVPAPIWGLTKNQLRKIALWLPTDDADVYDTNVRHMWLAPQTRERIRAFLDQKVGKKSGGESGDGT